MVDNKITFNYLSVVLDSNSTKLFEEAKKLIRQGPAEEIPSLAAFEAFAWDGVQIAGFEYGNCDNWLSRFLSGIIYLNAALVVQKPEVHAMLLKMSDEFATPEAFAKKIIRETDNHYSAIAYKFRDRVVKK